MAQQRENWAAVKRHKEAAGRNYRGDTVAAAKEISSDATVYLELDDLEANVAS